MKVLLGVTGASGAIIAEKLLDFFLQEEKVERVYFLCTKSGEEVIHYELPASSLLRTLLNERKLVGSKLRFFEIDNFFAPIASGSSSPSHMLIAPCSMGTMARIACSLSSNLLDRAADVVLKQKKQLIVCPRETPFHKVHLQHMMTLADLGASIVPPIPAFYQKPKDIDEMTNFMVGKLLEAMGLEHHLYPPWASRLC